MVPNQSFDKLPTTALSVSGIRVKSASALLSADFASAPLWCFSALILYLCETFVKQEHNKKHLTVFIDG